MKKLILFAFLIIVVFSSTAFSQINACYNWSVSGIGFFELLHDDVALRVSGIAGTEFIVLNNTPAYCNHDFDAWVYSELANSSNILSRGRRQSNSWRVEGRHPTFNATFRTYCVTSAHGLVDYWSYDDGKIFQNFTDEYTFLYTQDCHTFIPCPTNPSVACPTPTPTPTPPTAAITQRTDIIEKNGTKDLKITVTNNSAGTTKLNLRTTNGTGDAVFDANNTAELIINGNVTDQVFKIKGTTESSGVDNITVEAKLNTNTAIADHDEFTVAVISSLVFEANNSPLDNNPGTDGTHTADEGQRIFPDKNAPVDQTDRQSVKVKANILPTALNATVYFATYDLDDPSISTIIDTNGVTGNDNNGTVTGGTIAGLFSGTGCTVTADRADCSTTNGISEALLTVTMQPGDNFAIAASLTQDYRNGIVLDTANGSRILDATNNELPITRTAGNTVQGIRTNMLTVWRRLHIEVDSMGVVPSTGNNKNNETGTITAITKTTCPTPPNGCVEDVVYTVNNTNLEVNRFENGGIKVGTNRNNYSVKSNTANTITLNGVPAGSDTIRANSSFTLFDDDDMGNNNGTTLIGNIGENVPPLARTYLEDSDDPTLNRLAEAYIVPKYDIGNNNDFVNFVLNVATDDIAGRRAIYEFNQVTTEARENFWTIYQLSAYQYTTDEDEDPETEDNTVGVVDANVPANDGFGVSVFLESNGAKECAATASQPEFCNIHATKIHEIGHLFRAEHNQGGVMDDLNTNFDPRSIVVIRDTTHP